MRTIAACRTGAPLEARVAGDAGIQSESAIGRIVAIRKVPTSCETDLVQPRGYEAELERKVFDTMRFSLLAVSLFALVGSRGVMIGQTAATSNKAPKSFRDCADCPEMILLPAGSFTMGAGKADKPGFIDETPQHSVTVRSFAVMKFDVTRKEWAAFADATSRSIDQGCAYSQLPNEEKSRASWKHLGFPQDDRHPVVCVAFKDAQDYADWLSRKTRHTYRLMTEAEWEYAARAGTSTPYPWGAQASHEYANYGGNDRPGPGLAEGRDQWEGTSPVGSFPPNRFGLYDMNGNVMQWVQDCLSYSYSGLPADGSAFLTDRPITDMTGSVAFLNGIHTCSYRMLRGGDWGDTPGMIRSAFRNFAPSKGQTLSTYRSAGLGIRLARSAE